MTLLSARGPSRTAAQVSSQEVSIARINRRSSADVARVPEPHDHRVLAVVVVVAPPAAGAAEADALVHRDRGVVGDPDLEGEAAVAPGGVEHRLDHPLGDALAPPLGGD